jgi:hypothetical protein
MDQKPKGRDGRVGNTSQPPKRLQHPEHQLILERRDLECRDALHLVILSEAKDRCTLRASLPL